MTVAGESARHEDVDGVVTSSCNIHFLSRLEDPQQQDWSVICSYCIWIVSLLHINESSSIILYINSVTFVTYLF